ncbi:glycosyltransferase family 2 protein [bacterium]|nr:glycosyltransferase family 2 protein [bacterium]
MNNTPLVSVFLPYYNDRKFLKTSIESVLNQTYQNWELILLNHATTDDCREIAHSYQDKRIKHIDMKVNLGAGGGILFEKMLNASSGKYIKTLCADDELLPECLEVLVNYMETNPQVDFAFGDIKYINENGKDLKNSWFNSRQHFSTKHDEIDCIKTYIKKISFLPYIGNISKREILEKIHINKTFTMLFDMSLWLSLLCKGYKIGYCLEKIANYRISSNQLSSNKYKDRALKLSSYEHSEWWKIFQIIDNIELAKNVFPGSKYNDYLTKVEDIPFYVALNLFYDWSPHVYEYLSNILNNDDKREYYVNTFNFGIRELHQMCLENPKEKKQSFIKRFKNKYIYQIPAKKLNLLQLIFLILHRMFYIISGKPIFEKIKQRKNFSL